METQIPKEVYAYVVSWLNDETQIIPTVPQIVGAAASPANYLIKIKDDNPSFAIKALILGPVPAVRIVPTKIVTTSDSSNNYVYVGGSSLTGGIYRVINDSSPNTIPYISAANTNGIFDVDEGNKKLFYANRAGTAVIIHDLSIAPIGDITITTIYSSITDIKISSDGRKLLVAGTALIAATNTPIIDIYMRESLGGWQFVHRATYVPIDAIPTNVIVELVINKESTVAYAVNPVGNMISSIELEGDFAKTDKLLTGYTPNSIQIKGTELYIGDSSAPRILGINSKDLTLIKEIKPLYTPEIVPNKLAITAFQDALYVSPFEITDMVNEMPQYRIDVIDPITGIDTRKSTYNVGLFNQSPITTFTVFSEKDISPSAPVPDDRLQDLNEAVCIIATKVFSSCKNKDCFEDVTTPSLLGTMPYIIDDISFGKAVISNKLVTFINDGKNLSRVEFDVTVSYIINYIAGGLTQPPIFGILNLGHKDILMYIPQSSNVNEKDYKLVVETYTEILDGPKLNNNTFVFTVGVYEIFKIVEDVQLFIPVFGYCPVPIDFVPYIPVPSINICDKFLNNESFPEDFYPEDYPRVYPWKINPNENENPNFARVEVVGTVAIGSLYVIIIEVVITRAGSGIKDYYYDTDEYDNSLGNTPLYIDKVYEIPIVPPKNQGDTQQVNLYGSYKE